MTETLTTNFVPSLRKAAVCVYIATESSVADDIAEHLNKAADEIDRLTERLAGAYASVNLLTEMLEAKAPQEATGSQPVKRWNTKYPGISMLEHNGDLVRSGFGPYVLAEHYDQLASHLAEAIRMIEGYRRAGWITNPAALEQATDFALRAGNSHHE